MIGTTRTEQVHTVDVFTYRGWVRLEVTNEQACEILRAMADALGLSLTPPQADPSL